MSTFTQTLASHFSAEQKSALRLDRHSIVSAAAGSGKTRVLVERYIHILLAGFDPRNIVAITFTRKAAAEMLTRIAARIEEIIAKEESGSVTRRRLIEVQGKLSTARISTIHSFCANILREYPVEAGVSPDFVDVGSGDLRRIQEASIEHVLEDWLRDPERAAQARAMIFSCGQRRVESYLEELSTDAYHLTLTKTLYETLDDEAIVDVGAAYCADQFLQAETKLLSSLEAVFASVEEGKLSKKNKESFDLVREGVRLYVQNRFIDGAENADRIQAQGAVDFVQLISAIFTKAGEVSAWVSKASDGLSSDMCDILETSFKEIKALIETMKSAEIDRDLVRCARTLQLMAEDVVADMQTEKEDISALDYDDLQIRTLQLLQQDEVRAQLRRSIPFLMIDEFQDTNDLQYSIARGLVAALSDEQSSESNSLHPNIFIVGDAKQSIYGFRKADVRVFEAARHDITRANERLPEQERVNDDHLLGDVHLPASYRMAPSIVALVNHVCGSVMPVVGSGYEVGYEHMICARDAASAVDSHIELCIGTQTVDEQCDDDGTMRLSEGGLLAARLQKILSKDSDWMIWDVETKTYRRAEPRDVAILSRTAGVFEALTQDLRRYGIPFVRFSGRGFYQQQEVLDVISFLRFLSNPNDDIALAALLRSPFFALSDATLFMMRSDKQGDRLWKRLQNSAPRWSSELPAEHPNLQERERVARALSTLTHLLAQSRHSSVSQLLRFVLRETAFYGSVMLKERAEQIKANVEKCTDIVRDIESRGFRHLFDVVRELERLRDSDDGQSEAALISDENVVKLMTIHASKGLEFPIVALYNMSFKPNDSASFFSNETVGHCFTLRDQQGIDRRGALMHMSSQLKRQKEAAEEKRVLYVALTRARDHLILSCTQTDSDQSRELRGSGFMTIMAKAFPRPFSQTENSQFATNATLQVLVDNVTSSRDVQFSIDVVVRAQAADVNQALSLQPTHRNRPLLTEQIDTSMSGESFSATQLMTFRRDPQEYYRVYYMGLPPTDDTGFPARAVTADDERDAVAGTLAGEIIHAALARFREWWMHDGSIDELSLANVVTELLTGQSVAARDTLKLRVVGELRHLMSSSAMRSQRQQLQQARSEYTLTMPMEADFLTGTMDLVVECPDGSVEVWDWKTNRLDRISARGWLEHYQLQLHVYCTLLAKLYPSQTTFRARLIFTRSGEQELLELRRDELEGVHKHLQNIIREIADYTVTMGQTELSVIEFKTRVPNLSAQ